MTTDTISSKLIRTLSPDGFVVTAIRYGLAVLLLLFAAMKFAGVEASTQWIGDIKLAGVTIWAITLIQLVTALFLLWRTTYVIGAWFIILYGAALTWMSYQAPTGILISGIVFIVLAIILSVSDRFDFE